MIVLGTGTAPTRPVGDSSNAVATTAFVSGLVGNAAFFGSYTDAQAAHISAHVDTIILFGYYSSIGLGHSQYERVGSQPSHPGKLQSADGAWWELTEQTPNPYMFGAVGDDSNDDQPACQNLIDYVQDAGIAKCLTVPDGVFKINRVATTDSYFNGLVVRFKSFNSEDGITIIGQGGTFKCGQSGMTLLRLCQPGTIVQSLLADGGNAFWTGLTNTLGICAIPEDLNQITTVVSQNDIKILTCKIQFFEEGVVWIPGPTVTGTDSGAFYPTVNDCYFNGNTRCMWFKGAVSAPNNRPTRGNIAFNTLTRFAVGIDSEYATEFDFWGNEFELASTATGQPAGPLAHRCAYHFGADADGHKLWGGFTEAVDVDIFNEATSKHVVAIRDFPRTGVNIGIIELPKLHSDWLVLSPSTGTTGTMRVAGYFAGGVELLFDTAGNGTRNAAIATGSGTIREDWGATGINTFYGTGGNQVRAADGLSYVFTGTGAVISWGSGNYTFTHSAGNMVFAGGPLTAPGVAVNNSAVVANGIYLPAAATLGFSVGSLAKLQLTTTALSPAVDGSISLGTTSFTYSNLFLGTASKIDFASIIAITKTVNSLVFSGASTGYTFDAVVAPTTNDGAALGSTGLKWSDLFLANGAVIDFNSGNYTLTHSAGLLTASGGLTVSGTLTANTFASSGVTITGGTINNVVIGGSTPAAGTFTNLTVTSATVPVNGVYLSAANTLGFAVSSAGEVQLTATALSPMTNEGTNLGVLSTNQWANLYLGNGSTIVFNNDVTITHSTDALSFTGGVYLFDGTVAPTSTDVAPLGLSGKQWSDLFLADGAVINFNNGNYTFTHSSGAMTFAGGPLNAPGLVPTSNSAVGIGLNKPSAATLGFTADSTLQMILTSTALSSATNDATALGTTSLGWSDLFLASGGVINWANGNTTLTQSSQRLTVSGGTITETYFSSTSSTGYSNFALTNNFPYQLDFTLYGSGFTGTNFGISRNNLALLQFSGPAASAFIIRTSGNCPLVFGTSVESFRIDAAASYLAMASGIAFRIGNSATTGLVAGVLAATTNASIVITDFGGQAYRIPCII